MVKEELKSDVVDSSLPVFFEVVRVTEFSGEKASVVLSEDFFDGRDEDEVLAVLDSIFTLAGEQLWKDYVEAVEDVVIEVSEDREYSKVVFSVSFLLDEELNFDCQLVFGKLAHPQTPLKTALLRVLKVLKTVGADF